MTDQPYSILVPHRLKNHYKYLQKSTRPSSREKKLIGNIPSRIYWRYQGVNNYFGEEYIFDDENYFYVRHIDLGNFQVAILGLNSTWLSTNNYDRGKLVIGERQIQEALEKSKDSDIRFAVLHHPLDWLQEFDQRICETLLINNCEIILHGHLHKARNSQVDIKNKNTIIIGAGSRNWTDDFDYSYNMGILDTENGQGKVHFRLYVDKKGGFWTKDELFIKNSSDGELNFNLPKLRSTDIINSSETKSEFKKARLLYFRYLNDKYRYLAFKGMGVIDRLPTPIKLNDVYIPLKSRIDISDSVNWAHESFTSKKEELFEIHKRKSKIIPLSDLIEQHNCLIILGDPGSGKTTFLKSTALLLATQSETEHKLPILLPLTAYANALDNQNIRLDDFIAEYFHDLGSNIPMKDLLRQALDNGNAVIMLDGLDEVSNLMLRQIVIERIIDFYTFHRATGNKFIITSRIYGYREVRTISEGVKECKIVDLDDIEIEKFVLRWNNAMDKSLNGDSKEAIQDEAHRREDLIRSIHNNPGIRELSSNPLLLTILASMWRYNRRLPERRVELYDQYINLFLSSWNRTRSLGRPLIREFDEMETFSVLSQLALWIQEVSPTRGVVEKGDLVRQLETTFRERNQHDPERTAQQFMKDILENIGLLIEYGANNYGFSHIVFQEYLSAIAIVKKDQRNNKRVISTLIKHIDDNNWREILLLTIGYLGIIQQREEAAGEVVEVFLKNNSGELGKAVVLAGDAVADTMPFGVTASAKENTISALLETMCNDKRIKQSVRVSAGISLARIGDPRSEVIKSQMMEFCHVPSGEFLMGSSYDDDISSDDEKPLHTILIPYDYWIALFPVTIAQYSDFIEAGGYQEKRYWKEAKSAGIWQDGYISGRFDDYPRNKPTILEEPQNLPNIPITGVNWYEALAYCSWLSEKMKYSMSKFRTWYKGQPTIWNYKQGLPSFQLPSEAEWEKAARGMDNRTYPWGNEADPNRANYEQTDIGRPNPVGCFPSGISPYGVYELSGNTWEWTRSGYKEYPYAPKDGRENIDQKLRRVLRGGSYSSVENSVRCSSRSGNDPEQGRPNVGFRVIFISPNNLNHNQ